MTALSDRVAAGTRTRLRWRDPSWWRAPFVLARYPRLLAAVVASAAVLGLASAVGPLFLSSSSNAAFQRELEGLTDLQAGMRVEAYFAATTATLPQVEEVVTAAGKPIDEFGAPVETLVSTTLGVTSAAAGEEAEVRLRLLSRSEAQVRIVEGDPAAPGALIDEDTAAELGVGPGDELVVRRGDDRTTLPVTAVYTSLADQYDVLTLPEYWRPIASIVVPRTPGASRPAPLAILDRGTYLQTMEGFGLASTMSWEFPLETERRNLSVARAEEVATRVRSTADRLRGLVATSGEQLGLFSPPKVESLLPGAVGRVTAAGTTQAASVSLLTVAGRLVAILVVAATGVFLVRGRGNEFRMGLVGGRGAWRQGARTGVEAMLPVAGGAAAGALLALPFLRAVGPSALLDQGVVRTVAAEAGVTALTAVLGLAVVAGVTVVRDTEFEPEPLPVHRWRRLPWEAVVLLLAAASFYGISTRATVLIENPDGGLRLDALAIVFPFLFLVGIAGGVTRLLRRARPALRRVGVGRRAEVMLASRRLAASSGIAVVLITASSAAFGVGAYAAGVAAVTRPALETKSQVATGAEIVARLLPSDAVGLATEELGFPATLVTDTTGRLHPTGERVRIWSINPQRFGEVAGWDPSLASEPFETLLGRLAAEPADDAIDALLVGTTEPPDAHLSAGRWITPLRAVGRAQGFPGWDGDEPLVITSHRSLRHAAGAADPFDNRFQATTPWLWADTDPTTFEQTLLRVGVVPAVTRTAEQIRSAPDLLGFGWTIGFLEAMGAALVALALSATVLYLHVRQRDTEIAYALVRRMGMGRAAHRRAVALELAGLLATTFVIGVTTGLAATWLVHRAFDPLASRPPPPRFTIPWESVGMGAVTVVATVLLGAWLVQRSADRVNVAEVLRLAE